MKILDWYSYDEKVEEFPFAECISIYSKNLTNKECESMITFEHVEDIISYDEYIIAETKIINFFIEIYNKIDLSGKPPQWIQGGEGVPDKVWLSSKTGAGVDLLLKAIEERIHSTHVSLRFTLPVSEARLRAHFYQLDAVNDERLDDGGNWHLEVELPLEKWRQLAKTAEGSDADFVMALLKQHALDEDDDDETYV